MAAASHLPWPGIVSINRSDVSGDVAAIADAFGLVLSSGLEMGVGDNIHSEAKYPRHLSYERSADNNFKVVAYPIGELSDEILLRLNVERVPECVLALGLRGKNINKRTNNAWNGFQDPADLLRKFDLVFVHRLLPHIESPSALRECA